MGGCCARRRGLKTPQFSCQEEALQFVMGQMAQQGLQLVEYEETEEEELTLPTSSESHGQSAGRRRPSARASP